MNGKRKMAAFLLMAVAMPIVAMAGPGTPKDWAVAGNRPEGYEFGTEHVAGSASKQSAYIKARDGTSPDSFGTLMQTIKADNYIGQRVRVSANLKSADVTSLNLWMRVDGDGKMLGFYNMKDRPIQGTTDWKRYDVVLDVPKGATTINFGFFLSGQKGTGWADSFKLEKVDEGVPISASVTNKTPANMDFDQ